MTNSLVHRRTIPVLLHPAGLLLHAVGQHSKFLQEALVCTVTEQKKQTAPLDVMFVKEALPCVLLLRGVLLGGGMHYSKIPETTTFHHAIDQSSTLHAPFSTEVINVRSPLPQHRHHSMSLVSSTDCNSHARQ